MGEPRHQISKTSAVVKKIGQVAGPFLLLPAIQGALFFVVLSLWALFAALHDDNYEGADAAGVRQFLSGEYHGEVLRALNLTLATSALLGLGVGLIISRAIRARNSWLGLQTLHPKAHAWRSLAGIVLVYAFVWLDDIVARPALYQDFLYAKGGVRAALQTSLTQYCGRLGVWSLFSILLVSWLFLPLARSRDKRASLRQLAWVLLALGAGGVVAMVPWHRVTSRSRQTGDARPNVIVVAADSLRPDHITQRVAPRMSDLVQRGVAFEHAYTPLARTFPAWVSILTGNYPHHHGVRNMFPRWETRKRDYHAIPQSFRAAGYSTAVISDFAGDIFRRIDLGFERIQAPTFTMRELLRERVLKKNVALLPWLRGPLANRAIPVLREMSVASDAEGLTREALELIDDAGSRPFFLTVFYSTTHFPYAAPAPFYARFTKPGYRGPYRYAKADTLAAETSLSHEDVEQVRGLFDGAVATVDDAVGGLLDGLTARGLQEHTIIVLTADHGEGLYENGRGQGHGDHLYGDEGIRVPLVVVVPKGNPSKVNSPVSSIDLAPTLCELANVRCSPGMDGQSLAAAVESRRFASRPVFSETGLWFTDSVLEVPPEKRISYPDLIHLTEVDKSHSDEVVIRRQWELLTTAVKYRMMRNERYKLIYMPTRHGAKYELFDTQLDPAEVHDIAEQTPEVVEKLKPQLVDWILKDVLLERQGELIVPRVQQSAQGGLR